MTQPLIYEELCELGVDISVGQVNRLVTEGHDGFHEEKDDLLPAGLAVSEELKEYRKSPGRRRRKRRKRKFDRIFTQSTPVAGTERGVTGDSL